MKAVLFLLSHTEKGGGEVLAFNMIRRLDPARYRVFLGHVDFRKGAYIEEFRKLGLEPEDFKAGHLKDLVKTFQTVRRIAEFQRKNKIAAVVTTGAHSLIYAALARFFTGIPVLTHAGDFYARRFFENRPIIQAALLLKADYYLAASKSCLNSFEKWVPARVPRAVAYPCVDPDFYSSPVSGAQVRRELGLRENQKLISVIGRLQHWKGQDTFIRAAAKILERCPETRFAVVGGTLFGLEPEYKLKLEKLADDLGIRDKIFFAGHRDDVREWIAASYFLVHVSRTPEPGGTVISEIMSLGRPLIATSCGAPSELIRDGANGLLIEPEDFETLSRKAVELLDNPVLAERISKNGLRTVHEFLNMEKMIGTVTEALDFLCARQDARHE